MKYKLVLTNGNAVIVESENTLEEFIDDVCMCELLKDEKSGRVFFTKFIVWIEEQSNE